jgi:5-formyltetrahydrofolate cyclo-ligase
MAASTHRHDHDAGGDSKTLEAKAELRELAWARIREADAARFPAPEGRIPNFIGAEAAAELLRQSDVWAQSTTVKANPDSPQWPVRQRALEDGMVVFMAVPRLAEPEPFFLLDPDDLADTPRKASSIKGASRSARRITVAQLEPVDLVVTGCVAVDRSGARLGKGGGFSDLELAVAAEAGMIDDETVVVTTVHESQILDDDLIPMAGHDIGLDVIVTPDQVIRCPRRERPVGIDWEILTDDKIAAIPLLQSLRPS